VLLDAVRSIAGYPATLRPRDNPPEASRRARRRSVADLGGNHVDVAGAA